MSKIRHDKRLAADPGGRPQHSAASGADLYARRHVVHALPGRVRLRFPTSSKEHARGLARRFSAHPAVHHVSWREPIQSLTIYFDSQRSFPDIVATLPPDDGRSPDQLIEARGVDWGRIALSCLLSLLPLGVAGNLALTLALALAEELRRSQPPGHLTRPAAWAGPQGALPAALPSGD
jgi:hypothetical protein